MRNQTWSQQGQLLVDIELTRVSGVATAIDHIAGTSRPTTAEEEITILASENEAKLQDAKAKAVAAIKTNQGTTLWGKTLYDLAISQGWIEPE